MCTVHLFVPDASMSDGGVYWCIAENILGRAEAQAHVNITNGGKLLFYSLFDYSDYYYAQP